MMTSFDSIIINIKSVFRNDWQLNALIKSKLDTEIDKKTNKLAHSLYVFILWHFVSIKMWLSGKNVQFKSMVSTVSEKYLIYLVRKFSNNFPWTAVTLTVKHGHSIWCFQKALIAYYTGNNLHDCCADYLWALANIDRKSIFCHDFMNSCDLDLGKDHLNWCIKKKKKKETLVT